MRLNLLKRIAKCLPTFLKIKVISKLKRINNCELNEKDYIFCQNRYVEIIDKIKNKFKESGKIRVAFFIEMAEKFPANNIFRNVAR